MIEKEENNKASLLSKDDIDHCITAENRKCKLKWQENLHSQKLPLLPPV